MQCIWWGRSQLEEGLRSNGSHAVTRREKRFPGPKLLKMGQNKSEMVTEAADHAIKGEVRRTGFCSLLHQGLCDFWQSILIGS